MLDSEPRKGMPDPKLDKAQFRERFLSQYQDPAFDQLAAELEKLADAAWAGYDNSRKSPRTCKAGPGYADPNYDLAIDWIAAREAVDEAQRQHDDPDNPLKILLINGSSRSEHTGPGETSKSYRLVKIAEEIFSAAGRLFSVVTHGDVEGVENLRRDLSDWLTFMNLESAGNLAEVDRYIGYYKPYATNHAELDADLDIQEEVRNAARTLLEAVMAKRDGKLIAAGEHLKKPRQK
jgi:hypothetical protein